MILVSGRGAVFLPCFSLFWGLKWRTTWAGRALRGRGVKQAVPSEHSTDYTRPKSIRRKRLGRTQSSHTLWGQAWQHL